MYKLMFGPSIFIECIVATSLLITIIPFRYLNKPVSLLAIALVITAGIGGFLASENIYTTDGMEISSVVAGSPSQSILSEGMVIHKINGDVVTNTSSYTELNLRTISLVCSIIGS